MTRETKIGLLVGMGVIILIGILISDHLSEARKQQFAQMTNVARPEVRGSEIPAPPSLAKGPTQTLPVPGEENKPRAKPQPSTPSLANAGAVGMTRSDVVPPSHDDLVNNFKPAIRTDGAAAKPINGEAHVPLGFEYRNGKSPESYPMPPTGVDTIIQDTAPGVGHSGGNPGKAIAAAGAITNNAPPVAAPAGDAYHVKEGDTLYGIAKQFYGDGSQTYVNLIIEANKGKLPAPNRMRVGVRLMIPPKPGAAVAAPAAANAAVPPAPQTAPRAASNTPAAVANASALPAAATADYTVKAGETLASIARDKMGTKNWQKLYDLNKDRIKDPNRVMPGTVIRVPVKKITA